MCYLFYEFNKDGTISLSAPPDQGEKWYGYHYITVSLDDSGVIVLPEEIENRKVTAVKEDSLCFDGHTVILPSTVKTVDASIFDLFDSVHLPDGLTEITGSFEFDYYNDHPREIRLSSNHPIYAFSDGVLYHRLEKKLLRYMPGRDAAHFSVPQHITSIGAHAFDCCKNLKSIDLHDQIAEIGESAFEACTALEEIRLPDSILHLAPDIFAGCSSLKSIHLPKGLRSIGYSAFFYCRSLASVDLPASLESIGTGAFQGCTALKSITLPDSVTKLGHSVFEDCTALREVTLSDGITELDSDIFRCCSSLKDIRLPAALISLGYEAFKEFTALEEITLPKNCAEIGQYVFCGCANLKRIVFSENTRTILPGSPGAPANGMPFADCPQLEEFVVPDENPWFEIVSGALVDKLNHRLIMLPPKQQAAHFTVPEGIEIIEDSAFCGHQELTSISLPKSLKEIRTYAFYSTSLREIDLPETLSRIGNGAFANCRSLESVLFKECVNLSRVELPSSLRTIGFKAFDHCASLRQLILPEGMEKLYGNAVSNCENLELVSLPASLSKIEPDFFPFCPKVVLRVVKDSYAHNFFGGSRLYRVEVV